MTRFWTVVSVVAMTGTVAALACAPPVAEPDPQLLEAINWYTGEAGHVDDARAAELLELAAADEDPISVMWMARVYSRGRMGFEEDRPRALRLANSVIDEIERAAEAGVLEAVFLMGTAYDEALGKDMDLDLATEWHTRAANAGHTLGEHNLGNAFASGRGASLNHARAIEWWTKAAEKGDAVTQLRLGEAYEAGRGTATDREAALAWYEKAATAGNASAQEALERLREWEENR